MIISLEEAKQIDKDIDQDDLDAFEASVRALTNNNFQNKYVRYDDVVFLDGSTVQVKGSIVGLRPGDTIEVNYSKLNDGLYVVDELLDYTIKVKSTSFYAGVGGGMVTKVEYPADIKRGIKKLIKYDVKMGDKVGIKSETISRMSTTYYDAGSSENTDGYPAALLAFLEKYEKMRW